jgi:hypothetical protein
MRGFGSSRRLIRALDRVGEASGVKIAWDMATSAPWASALFVGERHVLMGQTTPGPALDAFLAALPEMEISLPNACVADLVACGDAGTGITVHALVIENC